MVDRSVLSTAAVSSASAGGRVAATTHRATPSQAARRALTRAPSASATAPSDCAASRAASTLPSPPQSVGATAEGGRAPSRGAPLCPFAGVDAVAMVEPIRVRWRGAQRCRGERAGATAIFTRRPWIRLTPKSACVSYGWGWLCVGSNFIVEVIRHHHSTYPAAIVDTNPSDCLVRLQ
jgi:hypothetical protein